MFIHIYNSCFLFESIQKFHNVTSSKTPQITLSNYTIFCSENTEFHKLFSHGIRKLKYKKEMIIGRYLFSLLVALVISIIALILFSISSLVIEAQVDWFTGMLQWAGSFIIATFIISVQFPTYVKLDFTKAMVMSILPFVLIFAIGSPIVVRLMGNDEFSNTVTQVMTYFKTRISVLVPLGLSIGILLLSLSCLISILLSKKK